MKTKALLAMVAMATFAGNLFGQGQVTLGNNASSLVRFHVWSGAAPNGDPVPVGSVSFQLYYGPVEAPFSSLMPAGPVVGTSATFPGRIANTVIDIPTSVVPAGGAATFQVWAWSGSFASYDLAQQGGGGGGKSALFTASTSPNGTPPPLPTSLAGRYPGFVITIPEPSTFVLVGLGVVSLLLYRRRK